MRYFIAGIILSCLISCTADDNTETCKMTSTKTAALYYDNIYLVAYNPNFSGKIRFEYTGGKITKILGGPQYSSFGFTDYIFLDTIENDVSYANDTIYVENNTYGYYSENPYVEKYVIKNGKLKYRKSYTWMQGSGPWATEATYEYSGDDIFEKVNGVLARTFHTENQNLVHVEQIHYGLSGEIWGKTTWSFSNHDDNDNLLKGKFFINGAFYTAFSKSNWREIVVQKYTYENGQFTPNENTFHSWYDADAQLELTGFLFETDCN